MYRYYFTFTVGSAAYRMDIKAPTRAIAERRLRSMFVKSAVVTIQSCTAVKVESAQQ